MGLNSKYFAPRSTRLAALAVALVLACGFFSSRPRIGGRSQLGFFSYSVHGGFDEQAAYRFEVSCFSWAVLPAPFRFCATLSYRDLEKGFVFKHFRVSISWAVSNEFDGVSKFLLKRGQFYEHTRS